MKFRVKFIHIKTGKKPYRGIMNLRDLQNLGVSIGDRIRIKVGKKSEIIIVEGSKSVNSGSIFLYEDVLESIGKVNWVEIEPLGKPESIEYILKKLKGLELKPSEIYKIVEEITNYELSDAEIALFVASIIASHSSSVIAMGFSQSTCFLASADAITIFS